jgi:AcrR family transcriptional regulator
MSDVKMSRQDKAATTRRRMLEAAYDLFCELGFRATTMAAIAERAGVAVQTLYFTFHTKDALLQEVHNRTVLGDDSTGPPQQQWYAAAVAAPDPQHAVALIVGGVAGILRRVAPMLPVFHSVAGDAAGAVFQNAEVLRRQGMRDLAKQILAKDGTRRDVSASHAGDLLCVLLGPETYRSFVVDLSWSEASWIHWTTDTLVRDLCGTA